MKKTRSKEHCLSVTIMTMMILISSCSGFNITKILSRHRERFSTINALLSRTGIAEQINRRRSITVLAFDNAAAASSSIASACHPAAAVEEILAAHVILDYYDVERLTLLGVSSQTPAMLPTLFQATGAADYGQGLLNVSLVGEGEIAFGSASPGGELKSKLVGTIADHPYAISVLQITAPIRIPGIDPTLPKPKRHLMSPPPPISPTPTPSMPMSPPLPRHPIDNLYDDSDSPAYIVFDGSDPRLKGAATAMVMAVLVAWILGVISF